jgi:hypothetical protein
VPGGRVGHAAAHARDAAGKDGAIGHALTGVNFQGCGVHSFKHPSAGVLEHDLPWRTRCRLPARGRIDSFNRSYGEHGLTMIRLTMTRARRSELRTSRKPLAKKDSGKSTERRSAVWATRRKGWKASDQWLKDKLIEHKQYIDTHGEDLPESGTGHGAGRMQATLGEPGWRCGG